MEAVARRIALTAAVLAAALVPTAAHAATIDVTTESDVVANDGVCSLREAIDSANGRERYPNPAAGECRSGDAAGTDTVVLGEGFYVISIPPFNGPFDQELNDLGDFGIESDVEIRGAGRTRTAVDGGSLDRVFYVRGPASAVFADLTISGGRTPHGPSGYWARDGAAGAGAFAGEPSIAGAGSGSDGGGGILNRGTTTIRDAARAQPVARRSGSGARSASGA